MPDENRQQLFNVVIPIYKLAYADAIKNNDKNLAEFFKHAIEKLYDFDLTPFGYYKNRETCFINYLKRICQLIGIDAYLPMSSQLGDSIVDRAIFLLNMKLNQLPLTEPQKNIFKYAVPEIKLEWWGRRGSALLALADKDAHLHSLSKHSAVTTDWQAWIDLLDKTSDSGEIWRIAQDKYYDQLLNLIIDHQVKFFHPYLPLTAEKHCQLKLLAEDQLKQQLHDDYRPKSTMR